MADTKISALTGATTPLAGTEVLPIVQSSTTKQVSVANLTAGRDISATAVQATNSGGLALKNSGGTTQLSLGAGGGDNITLSVATNITPANAAVAISPTGTGTVTINPAAASTINNTSIGATTASTGRFTNVTATTGSFVVGTSGQGIDFSATPGTGTSELLADYEEGTWTPVAGSGTFSSATGTYTKIGRVVNLTFGITVGTGGATNMTGAPFTCGFNASNSIYTEGQLYPAGGTSPLTLMGAGGTTVNFVCVGSTLGFTSLTLTASAVIIGSLTYTV